MEKRVKVVVIASMVVLVLWATGSVSFAAEPCCNVSLIDQKSGIVTAKVKATGATFTFKVSNSNYLKGLKVGDAVDANFQTAKVAITKYSLEPCCNIVQAPRVMQPSPGALPAA